MTHLAIGAVMEILDGEYFGTILGAIERVAAGTGIAAVASPSSGGSAIRPSPSRTRVIAPRCSRAACPARAI